jgi:pimeloyl-ACP methyl ester carboxylesterase
LSRHRIYRNSLCAYPYCGESYVLEVNNADIYAYTGGKAFDAAKPTAIFIHGVLCDHSVWALQSRYMANHGWNVLAIDLPGHCKSGGQAPETVEEAAASSARWMRPDCAASCADRP